MLLRCITMSLLVTFTHSGILTKKGSSDGIYLQQLVSTGKAKTPDQQYFQCQGHGLHANEGACRTFYHCVDLSDNGLRWLAFKFTCPEGMFFDSYSNECFSLEYWSSSPPSCHEREEGKRISQTHGSQAEPGQALVVTTDSQSNDCEHMQEDASHFSNVKGQREGIEVVADGMIRICEILVNATSALVGIKSKQPLVFPQSDSILYANVSSDYNDDLSHFQSYFELWIGDNGIIKSLEDIYTSIKDFEPNFIQELWKVNRNNGSPLIERSMTNAGIERNVLTELTQNIKTCFNFSEYGYSAQAMLAFLMNDLDEQTIDLMDTPTEAESEKNQKVQRLGTFFKYILDAAEQILNKTQNTIDLFQDSRQGIYLDYSSMRDHRKKALQITRVFEEEKEGYEKRLQELERQVPILQNSMHDEFSHIATLKKTMEHSYSVRDISSSSIRISGIFKAVHSLMSIWDRISNGNRTFFVENTEIIQKNKLYIKQHENKIKTLFFLVQNMKNEASLIKGNILSLENEITYFRVFVTETEELMREADSFMHTMAMISSILEDVENIFGTFVEEIKGYVFKCSSFESSKKKTLLKLHFYMAIENLKWSWHQIGRRIDSLSKGDHAVVVLRK